MAKLPQRESGDVEDGGEGMWYEQVDCHEISDGGIVVARAESVS